MVCPTGSPPQVYVVLRKVGYGFNCTPHNGRRQAKAKLAIKTTNLPPRRWGRRTEKKMTMNNDKQEGKKKEEKKKNKMG